VLAAAEVLGPLRTGVIVALRDDGRDIIGLLAVADERVQDAFGPEDVTLLEQLATQMAVVVENSMSYAQMKERDRLAVLGQMAAGLAHEIRNPLGAIKGAAQLLAEPRPGESPDPSSGEFIGIILEEVDRLDRVVGSVLDLAHRGDRSVLPVDVNAVVRRTAQIVSAELRSEGVELLVLLEPDLPRVRIDPEQLRQVLLNLVRNALQAVGDRGKVTLSTRMRFGRTTRSERRSEDPYVEIHVADTGPGISRKVLDKIFLPFFTTKEKGTGLGLAISQRIVQNAQGRIEVRSYEGRGSTFTVVLPAAQEAATGTPSPGDVLDGAKASPSVRPSALVRPASTTSPPPADAGGGELFAPADRSSRVGRSA
jgi:signal transduction histidine kinase